MLSADLGWPAIKLLRRLEADAARRADPAQWASALEKLSAYSLARRWLESERPNDPALVPTWLARRAFLAQESGRIKTARELYRRAEAGLSPEFRTRLSFEETDAVDRWGLESKIEACQLTWHSRSRARTARLLEAPCHHLLATAEDAEIAAILRIRRAEIADMAGSTSGERLAAATMAAEALAAAIAVEHVEAEAAAGRLLLRMGRRGRAARKSVLSSFPGRPRAPFRERWKTWVAHVQGLLPDALYPWKAQLPLVWGVKAAMDAAVCTLTVRRLDSQKRWRRGDLRPSIEH